MDGFKEFQGKNLDAAIQEACSYYNVAREKLDTPLAPIRPLTAEELAGGAPQVATTVN